MAEKEEKWPVGYRVEDRKLEHNDPECGIWSLVTLTLIEVIAFVRDAISDAVSVLVAVEDYDGNRREVSIPAASLLHGGSKAARLLADAGLKIVPGCEKLLARFIQLSNPAGRLLRTDLSGWLQDRPVFVRPDGIIAAEGDGADVLYDPKSKALAAAIYAKGTLVDWQREVASLARGNLLAVFVICAALVGPLLKLAGFVGGGFHLYGRSSRGKTTLLQLSASIWVDATDPSVPSERSGVRSWHVTGNSLDALCLASSDQLLALDEIGTYAGKDIDELIYRLAGGQEKSSLTSSRKLRDAGRWRSNILSTGEVSVRQRIEAASRTPMAGQLARLADIPIGEIFTETGDRSPAEFASHIKYVSRKFFGTAGPAFVASLIEMMGDDPEALAEALRDHAEAATMDLAADGTEPEMMRVLRRFGLVVTAGELAVQFGILPFNDDEVKAAVRHARDLWLRGGEEISDNVRALDRLRAFILRHHGTFVSIDNPRAYVSGARGFFNPRVGAYLFDREQLIAATGNANPEEVARELRDRGLLICHEPSRLQAKQRLAWLDGKWVRFFTVRTSILGEAEDSEMDGQMVKAGDPLGLDD